MGNAAPSLTSRLLQEGVTPEDEEILKWVSFEIYLGVVSKYPPEIRSTYVERGCMIYQVDLTR